MKEIKVLSVNVSQKKGTVKHPVPLIRLNEQGIEDDAHSGPWNRQVSLLGVESIRNFEQEAKRKIGFGEFAENMTTEGIELWNCQPLDRFTGNGVELEVTQIGKECHGSSCAIFREVGNCVMPREGIFARVVKPGTLSSEEVLTYLPKLFTARIITLSDRAMQGIYEDLSGPRIKELLESFIPDSYATDLCHQSSIVRRLQTQTSLIPDDPGQLQQLLEESVAKGYDFIFTCGGTGIGPRDFTPDIVKPMLDKEIPGIMEMIRMKYGASKPNALVSRSVAGVIKRSLVFTLPGSVKAVNEYMDEIFKSLIHLIYMLHSLDNHK